MCVAATGVVVEMMGREALVDFNGNKVKAKAGLVDVVPGDHVLVHAGCILQKVTEAEAQEMEDLYRNS